MRVGDICNLQVRSCSPGTNLARAASLMWEQDCGCIPVVDESNRVVGVLTDRDICMAVATRNLRASEITAGEVVSPKVHTCRLDDDVRTALRTMHTNGVRRLPVVNNGNDLVGILSLTDLILASREPRSARPGEITWGEVIPTLDFICRPRRSVRPAAVAEKRQILVPNEARH